MVRTSAIPLREPHWLPADARTGLTAAISTHLDRLDELDPDRFALSDVIVELGVASARSQLDQVPSRLMRAAAGISVNSFQIRLSGTELEAILRVPNLPMNVTEAFATRPRLGPGRKP